MGSRVTSVKHFNPLPSHEGRRRVRHLEACASVLFQSTPLTRGETGQLVIHAVKQRDFNPLPSHEGRRGDMRILAIDPDFNPLPSHEGRPSHTASCRPALTFQSTPLTRGETSGVRDTPRLLRISIHSPHTRGDSINFQRIHRIQGILYNTIHFTRFCEFFQPV